MGFIPNQPSNSHQQIKNIWCWHQNKKTTPHVVRYTISCRRQDTRTEHTHVWCLKRALQQLLLSTKDFNIAGESLKGKLPLVYLYWSWSITMEPNQWKATTICVRGNRVHLFVFYCSRVSRNIDVFVFDLKNTN